MLCWKQWYRFGVLVRWVHLHTRRHTQRCFKHNNIKHSHTLHNPFYRVVYYYWRVYSNFWATCQYATKPIPRWPAQWTPRIRQRNTTEAPSPTQCCGSIPQKKSRVCVSSTVDLTEANSYSVPLKKIWKEDMQIYQTHWERKAGGSLRRANNVRGRAMRPFKSDCALLKRSDPYKLHISTFPRFCPSKHVLHQEWRSQSRETSMAGSSQRCQ